MSVINAYDATTDSVNRNIASGITGIRNKWIVSIDNISHGGAAKDGQSLDIWNTSKLTVVVNY